MTPDMTTKAGVSRKDPPPSPPQPPRPPPPSPEKKHRSLQTAFEESSTSRSRQDPPSPPRAPPPSPAKVTPSTPIVKPQPDAESPEVFPRLVELSMSLGDVLDLTPTQASTDRRQSYLYCEDDMSVPGSPPPLEFPTPKPKSKVKRGAEELSKEPELFGPSLEQLAEVPASNHKRRKATIRLDDAIVFLPPAPEERNRHTDFFSALFSGECDTTLLHEHAHRAHSCIA